MVRFVISCCWFNLTNHTSDFSISRNRTLPKFLCFTYFCCSCYFHSFYDPQVLPCQGYCYCPLFLWSLFPSIWIFFPLFLLSLRLVFSNFLFWSKFLCNFALFSKLIEGSLILLSTRTLRLLQRCNCKYLLCYHYYYSGWLLSFQSTVIWFFERFSSQRYSISDWTDEMHIRSADFWIFHFSSSCFLIINSYF